MASVIPTCFSSTIWVKVFSWVSNFNFMQVTTKKTKTFAEVHDHNPLHATEEFQYGIFVESYYEYS